MPVHYIASASLSLAMFPDGIWIAVLVGVIIGFLIRGKFG